MQPKVSRAFRQRDLQQQHRPPGALPYQLPQLDPAELDRPIAKAQGEPADSDATLQEAAPNYPQLVQQVTRAADVPARSNVSHLQNAMLSQEAEQG